VNEPTTVGGIVLIVSLAALFAVVRAWPGPDGRHRSTTAAVELVRLDDLMPDWPQPAYGAVVAQAFRHCRSCREVTPVVLHPGAHTCTAGHVTITPLGGNR
jgi:hypothetical protein